MKNTLLLIGIFITLNSKSQHLSKNKDTLYTSRGWAITKGDKLTLNLGSHENGNFKYIFPLNSGTGKYDRSFNLQFKASHSGDTIVVKKIKKFKSRERGDVYILIVHVKGIIPFMCDIEKAIEYYEILSPINKIQ